MKKVSSTASWRSMLPLRLYETGLIVAIMCTYVSSFGTIFRSHHSSILIVAPERRRNPFVSPNAKYASIACRYGISSSCQSHTNNNPHDEFDNDATLLPPNCQLYLPSFLLNPTSLTFDDDTSTTTTSPWDWVLWENQPIPATSAPSIVTTPKFNHPSILSAAATAAWETWRWCANVVVPLQLCPWAASSVQTPHAIRMYLVVESPMTAGIRKSINNQEQVVGIFEQRMRQALALAVNHWWKDVLPVNDNDSHTPSLDPKTAIAFCVHVSTKTTLRKSKIISVVADTTAKNNVERNNNNKSPLDKNHDVRRRQQVFDDRHDHEDYIWDFDSFYDWYVDLEENQDWWRRSSAFDRWTDHRDDDDDDDELAEQITLAPFHPDWQYYDSDSSGDEEQEEERKCWAFEKKSPHPTISMVSTSVVEQAGPAMTERTATNNADILTKLGADHLSKLYRDQVLL